MGTRYLIAVLLLAQAAFAAAPDSASIAAQKRDFTAIVAKTLTQGRPSAVTSIAQTLGFDKGLKSKVLRYSQNDSPDDCEHVFAVFFTTNAKGVMLAGAQVSREKARLGIDGKTLMSGVAYRLDSSGLVVRAIEIPEGPINDLEAAPLGVGLKTIREFREELKFYAETVAKEKLRPAGS